MTPTVANVGGQLFTTLPSTLLAALLADRWADALPRIDGVPFIDRNPRLFEHVLDFLRSSTPPVWWSPAGGFDLAAYANLLCEAGYFQLHALAEWIRDARYTPTVNRELLATCEQGLTPHAGNVQKDFDAGTVTTASNSGRSITHWKRVHVRTTVLHPPVRNEPSLPVLHRLLTLFLGQSIIPEDSLSILSITDRVRPGRCGSPACVASSGPAPKLGLGPPRSHHDHLQTAGRAPPPPGAICVPGEAWRLVRVAGLEIGHPYRPAATPLSDVLRKSLPAVTRDQACGSPLP